MRHRPPLNLRWCTRRPWSTARPPPSRRRSITRPLPLRFGGCNPATAVMSGGAMACRLRTSGCGSSRLNRPRLRWRSICPPRCRSPQRGKRPVCTPPRWASAASSSVLPASVLQQAELELWRDNIDGALELLTRAHALAPDPRYAARVEEIRSWLRHLDSAEAYAAAYEAYYRRAKRRLDWKRLERDVRILLGRKTGKTLRRIVENSEYRLLEREVTACNPSRVLDAGCGEGRIALSLGHRFPSIHVTAVEVSATNVGLARRMNRFRNVTFEHGLIEDVVGRMPPGSFDLIYSFAVLEHVRDVEITTAVLLRVLRPGGRFCFIVPMNELTALGPVPAFQPRDGVAGHVRVFTEAGLRKRFGHLSDFSLTKVPGRWRAERYPAAIEPLEFGA